MKLDYWNALQTYPELAELAEDWLTTPRPDWADCDEVINAWICDDPDKALGAICAIARAARSEEELGSLSAGHLENFLGAHGEQYFEVVRSLAHQRCCGADALIIAPSWRSWQRHASP